MSEKEEMKEHMKAEAKQEVRKLKEMSWRDRFWYIWEYYKWHIVGIGLILCVCSIIWTSIYNSTLVTKLYCVIINNPTPQLENLTVLTTDFAQTMEFGKKELVYAESMVLPTDGSFDEMAMASQVKLSAIMASRELDIIISDDAIFRKYAKEDSLLDLETALPADLLDAVRDRLIYAQTESGQEHAYAIDVAGTQMMKNLGISTDPACFSIFFEAKNVGTAISLLRLIFPQ